MAQTRALPGGRDVVRFAWRWWDRLAVQPCPRPWRPGGAGCGHAAPGVAIATAGRRWRGPVGLNLRGRTSRLAWTRRLSLVAAVTWPSREESSGSAPSPGVIRRGGCRWRSAPWPLLSSSPGRSRPEAGREPARAGLCAAGLRAARPGHDPCRGITGSYGKTTTKNYIAYLLGGERNVVASPRSFNNRAGPHPHGQRAPDAGTDVLVAEMGAYGPGRSRPSAHGCARGGSHHFDRPRAPGAFGTLERTLEAKAEITSGARLVVLNVDDSRWRRWPSVSKGPRRWSAASGTDAAADVAVLAHDDGLELTVAGKRVRGSPAEARVPRPSGRTRPAQLAVALELGISARAVAAPGLARFRRAQPPPAALGPRAVTSCSTTPSTPTRPAPAMPSRCSRHSRRRVGGCW